MKKYFVFKNILLYLCKQKNNYNGKFRFKKY